MPRKKIDRNPKELEVAEVKSSDKILLTVKEAAKLLNLSVSTLYKLTEHPEILPCVRIGSAVRYSRKGLEEWAAKGGMF